MCLAEILRAAEKEQAVWGKALDDEMEAVKETEQYIQDQLLTGVKVCPLSVSVWG